MIRDQFLKKISKRDKKQVARCKEQHKKIYTNLIQSYQKPVETFNKNNNAQRFEKPHWLLKNC